LLDGEAAGLADDVADHQDPERAVRPRRVAVRGIAGAGSYAVPISLAPTVTRRPTSPGYFAYSTARVSRMTVTLIWPG